MCVNSRQESHSESLSNFHFLVGILLPYIPQLRLLRSFKTLWGPVASKRRQTEELEWSYEGGYGIVDPEALEDLNAKFCSIFIFSFFQFSIGSVKSVPISPKRHKKYQCNPKLISLQSRCAFYLSLLLPLIYFKILSCHLQLHIFLLMKYVFT